MKFLIICLILRLILRLSKNVNSFLLKGWAVTLISALFALAAKDANIRYVFITYIHGRTAAFLQCNGRYPVT